MNHSRIAAILGKLGRGSPKSPFIDVVKELGLLLNHHFPVTVPLSILRNSRRQELEDTENQRLFIFYLKDS